MLRLISEGSKIWKRIRLASSKDANSIVEHPSLEDFALSKLGITKQDLLKLEEEKKDKREYIRKVIAESDPSFGRFMTQVYQHYQRLRASGNREASRSLLRTASKDLDIKALRQKVTKNPLSEEDLFDLCVLLYKISRAKA